LTTLRLDHCFSDSIYLIIQFNKCNKKNLAYGGDP
jgi:hypothetical protein